MKLPSYKYYFAIFDILISLISFYEARAVVLIYKKEIILADYYNLFGVSYLFISWSILFSLILVFIFQNNNLYKINLFLSRSAQLTVIIKSILFYLVILIITSFFVKLNYIIDSRLLVVAYSIILFINLLLFRVLLLNYYYRRFINLQKIRKNVVIIGAGQRGKFVAAKIIFEEIHGLELLGFIDDNYATDAQILDRKNLGHTNQIKNIAEKYNVEEFIIAINNITHDRLLELIDLCNKTSALVRLHSSLFDIINKKIYTEAYSDLKVIEVSQRFVTKVNLIFKRIFDLVFGTIGLILLLPILIVIAILIKISSRGPVLFTQTRIGKDGKKFTFYKFRTMYLNTSEDNQRKEMMIKFMKNSKNGSNSDTKIVLSESITMIGQILRKTSLDELPQLLNVLKGEMSLVGPRPCLPYEYENYDLWQKRRLSVTPGCTGLWQVTGRSNVSFNDSVILDLYYINNMSPWLDLQLVIKTIPVMLFGRGGR
ncbi:MAG: sugar transferase [Melioribacteraceae bacterium]|nr:sugar transferase [Melioribacteraceae bacterium]